MTPLELTESYKTAISEAREVSELWTGTLIGDTLDAKIEALIKALDNGETDRIEDVLLPALIEDTDQARYIYEQQEMGVEW